MSADIPCETLTDRLLLRRPEPGDLDAVFAIHADPRVWTHFPSLRPTEPEQIDPPGTRPARIPDPARIGTGSGV